MRALSDEGLPWKGQLARVFAGTALPDIIRASSLLHIFTEVDVVRIGITGI